MKKFQLFINNQWVDAEGGKTFTTANPCAGEVIAEMASDSVGNTQKAIEAAHAAFESGCWSGLEYDERAEYLHRVADGIDRRMEELARSSAKITSTPCRALKPSTKRLRWPMRPALRCMGMIGI
jgi:NAD-dependent aldehyde dehydrogenases